MIAEIVAVVNAFITSIVAIAAGQIGAAAGRVESILAGLLSLAISFLMQFAGLGKVADKIMGVINKARAMIDKGIDWLINFIVTGAKKFLAALVGKKGDKDKKDDRTDAQKQADLTQAISEAASVIRETKLSHKKKLSKLASIK